MLHLIHSLTRCGNKSDITSFSKKGEEVHKYELEKHFDLKVQEKTFPSVVTKSCHSVGPQKLSFVGTLQ